MGRFTCLAFQRRASDTLKKSQKSSHIVLMRSNLQKGIFLTDPTFREKTFQASKGIFDVTSETRYKFSGK
jgi:hypothetical protein